MVTTWLCTYRALTEDETRCNDDTHAGLIVNVSADDLGDHLCLLGEANDWEIVSCVELHHDQLDSNNVEWVAKVFVDGQGFLSIRDLPVLG